MLKSNCFDPKFVMLSKFDNLMNLLNIKYCLIAGSLLGCVRHRGIMSWDNDIDLMMSMKNIYHLMTSDHITKHGYTLEKSTKSPWWDNWPVWVRLGPSDPVIDLWPWWEDGDPQEIRTVIGTFRDDKTFPYRMAAFEDTFMPIPQDPYHYLDRNYKTWRTEIVYKDSTTKIFDGPIPDLIEL